MIFKLERLDRYCFFIVPKPLLATPYNFKDLVAFSRMFGKLEYAKAAFNPETDGGIMAVQVPEIFLPEVVNEIRT